MTVEFDDACIGPDGIDISEVDAGATDSGTGAPVVEPVLSAAFTDVDDDDTATSPRDSEEAVAAPAF